MSLMLSTSHSALVVDAQAELPEDGAAFSNVAMVPCLHSQPQLLNHVAKNTELAK